MPKSFHESLGSTPGQINIGDLQKSTPNPNFANVLGACDIAVLGSYGTSMYMDIVESIYGRQEAWANNDSVNNIASEDLATSIFVKTLGDGIANAENMEQFDWRIKTFFQPEAIDRAYVGNPLSVVETRINDNNPKARTRLLDMYTRNGMAIMQVVKFCESNPRLESVALETLYTLLALKGISFTEKTNRQFTNALTDKKLAIELMNGQTNETRKTRQDILDTFEYMKRWNNNSQAEDDEVRSLEENIKSLEFVPVGHISTDSLETIELELTADEDHKPALPQVYILSSLQAVKNFLTSLVPNEKGATGIIPLLITKLKRFNTDDPLGYSDFIQIANQLVPIYVRQGVKLEKLDQKRVTNLPEAIRRVTDVALAENKLSSFKAMRQEHYEMAANCIILVAKASVEGKLRQVSDLRVVADDLGRKGVAPERARVIISELFSRENQKAAIERANVGNNNVVRKMPKHRRTQHRGSPEQDTNL